MALACISLAGLTRNGIAKLSAASGNAFSGFDGGTVDGVVLTLAVSGSAVYAGGSFTQIGGQPRFFIGKLSATSGNAVAAWNPNAGSSVDALAVDGAAAYAGGAFTQIGGFPRRGFAQFSR